MGSKLSDISLSNFFGYVSSGKKNKRKINRWEHIELKSFCTVKETIDKTKWQPTEWEKIFANHISNKALISKNIQGTHITQYQKKSD